MLYFVSYYNLFQGVHGDDINADAGIKEWFENESSAYNRAEEVSSDPEIKHHDLYYGVMEIDGDTRLPKYRTIMEFENWREVDGSKLPGMARRLDELGDTVENMQGDLEGVLRAVENIEGVDDYELSNQLSNTHDEIVRSVECLLDGTHSYISELNNNVELNNELLARIYIAMSCQETMYPSLKKDDHIYRQACQIAGVDG